jgi:hypothetical protein
MVANPPKPEKVAGSGVSRKKVRTMTLQDVIDHHYRSSEVDFKACAGRCKNIKVSMKFVMHHHPPKVLYVAIGLSDDNLTSRRKARTKISNLTSNVVLPLLGGEFASYAVTVAVRHAGKSVDEGHYVAEVRDLPQIGGGARDDNVTARCAEIDQCGGWSIDNEKVSRLEKFTTEVEGLAVVALRRIDFPAALHINGSPASLPPVPTALSSPIASGSALLPSKASDVPAAPIGVPPVVTTKPKKRLTSPGPLAIPAKAPKKRSVDGQFAKQEGSKKKRG